MTRKERNSLLAAWLALAVLAGGCAKKYQHERMTLDGPVAQEARALLEELRKAADDETRLHDLIRRQVAEGLADKNVKQLEAALAALARGKDVQLTRLDRFGKAYRVGFRLTDPQTHRARDSFFVVANDGKLRWLKTNN
jgi:hypothetical protein